MMKTGYPTVASCSGRVVHAFTHDEVEAAERFHDLVRSGMSPDNAGRVIAYEFYVTDEFIEELAR